MKKYNPLIFILLCLASSLCAQNEEPYTFVEQMPMYGSQCMELPEGQMRKSCSDSLLYADISSKMSYPDSAAMLGIQGTVVVRFVVQADGSPSGAEVVRGIGGGCDEEAIRVVSELDGWMPGKKEGRPVAVQMHLPLRFTLREIPVTIRTEKFEELKDLFCLNYLTDFAKADFVQMMAEDTLESDNICQVSGLPNRLRTLKVTHSRADGTSQSAQNAEGAFTPAMRNFFRAAQAGDVMELEFVLIVTTRHPETGEEMEIEKEFYRSVILE